MENRFGGTYEEYLQTPHWRKVRGEALRCACHKCTRCPATKALQVHHKTYMRLGCEEPGDLEVVCLTCHQGHHIDEDKRVHGIYVKLVSECLRVERFTSMADLIDAVKVACVDADVPYDGRCVWRAVELVDANRKGVIDAPRPVALPVHVPMENPISAKDAKVILERLKITAGFRSIPPLDSAEDEEAVRRAANAFRNSERPADGKPLPRRHQWEEAFK